MRIYRVNEERRNHIVNVHVGELCSEIAVVNEKNQMKEKERIAYSIAMAEVGIVGHAT